MRENDANKPGALEYSVWTENMKMIEEISRLRAEVKVLRAACETTPEFDVLNQAYENAEKVATERLAEIRELKTEVDRLNRLLAPYTDMDNWYENENAENVFCPDGIWVRYPWKLGGDK